jgi:hypothetical protein
MILDQLFRIDALVDTFIERTFPVLAGGIHPRVECKQYWQTDENSINWHVEFSPVFPHYKHLEIEMKASS